MESGKHAMKMVQVVQVDQVVSCPGGPGGPRDLGRQNGQGD